MYNFKVVGTVPSSVKEPSSALRFVIFLLLPFPSSPSFPTLGRGASLLRSVQVYDRGGEKGVRYIVSSCMIYEKGYVLEGLSYVILASSRNVWILFEYYSL